MASSDPYGDDDFFDNPDALLAIEAAEAQAVSASQAVAPQKQPQRYHHTVSTPRAGSTAAPFGRRKDGTPKAPAPLNVQPGSVAGGFGWEAGGKRVVEGNLARHLAAVDKRQAYWNGGKEEDEAPMDFMVDATGRYARGGPRQEEEDVVDNRHVSITIAASQVHRNPPDPRSALARRQAIAAALATGDKPDGKRTFARSISASSHMVPPRVDPVLSQPGSQPSSQGAAVRKLHLDLEGRGRRVEELERQLASVQKGDRPLWRDEVEVDVNHDEAEQKRKFNELQMKVYEAEGRAATLERNKQKDISRYAAEAEKLKTNIEALQMQMQAKEREYKQQLESLKSQAVFNNHAVLNSVVRGRQSSQRPAPLSPRNHSDSKPKPVVPQPGFKNLVNGFSGPSRAKRQRTQEASPMKIEPRTPEASPSKPQEVEVFNEVLQVSNRKAELLHHLFSYTYPSPLRKKDKVQPAIFYILNHHSDDLVDPGDEYPLACANILRACGDLDLDFDGLIREISISFVRILAVFEETLDRSENGMQDVSVICDVLRLLSRTGMIFPTMIDSMVVAEAGLGARLYSVARKIPQLCERAELAGLMIDAGEAICFGGDGRAIWQAAELVDFILLFAQRGVDLFFAASCSASHFRALTAGPPEGGQPLLDAMARLLVLPHREVSAEEYRQSTLIIRAFCMLAVSDPNGVLLVSERTVLVPCLVKVLHRESIRIWGINYGNGSLKEPLSLLHLALTLLHHLAYPAPYTKPGWSMTQGEAATAMRDRLLSADSDPEPAPDDLPQGLNIGDRLIAASQTREFNGIHYVFQAALGAMAFAEVDIDSEPEWRISADDLRRMQYLSQDLLEAVAEGPEVDAIYEIYAGEEEEIDEGVDPDAYAEMGDVQME